MKQSVVAAVALGALVSQPLSAQSLRSFEETGRSEARAMVGLTIPLGGKSKDRNSEPRLDFRFDTSRVDNDPFRARPLNPLLQDRRDVRATTVSLTFEANPKLLLNQQKLVAFGHPLLRAQDEGEEPKKERGTGEKVARGLGWVGIGLLGVTAAGVGYFAIRCGGDDGDCFDEN